MAPSQMVAALEGCILGFAITNPSLTYISYSAFTALSKYHPQKTSSPYLEV